MAEKTTKEKILAQLGAVPVSTGQLANLLDLTTQAIHKQLAQLRSEGLAEQIGKGRAARWVGRFQHHFSWNLQGQPTLGESEMWQHVVTTLESEWESLNDNARAILNYSTTEILNNAIDHSQGTTVELFVESEEEHIALIVIDNGVGAFQNVQQFFNLSNTLEAISHVAKGRQTTWAERHTGQGLFFTSRAVDLFEVEAGGYVWQVDNLRHDTTVFAGIQRSGTRVVMRTRKQSKRTLKDVFDQHSIEEFEFDKGAVRVTLSQHGTEIVSRSEAKRLAVGLDLYGEVELDFTGVKAVGQGFVDELFRVWVREHPGTTFTYVNANEEVAFMIERGLPPR